MEVFTLIQSSDIEGVKAWIESKTTNKNVVKSRGQTPLQYAIKHEKENIAKLFIEKKLYISEMCINGETPLHYASMYGYANMTSILIERGARVNAVDKNMRLPIHCAAYNVNFEVVCILINNGSEINAIDKYGDSPLIDSVCAEKIFKTLKAFSACKILLDEGAALFNNINYLKFAEGDSKTLVKYHLKLQAFILVCGENNILIRYAILRFSNTFKLSFKK